MSGVPGPLADAALGLRLFARGARTVLGSGRLLLLGAVPALVVTVLYVAALVVLLSRLPDLTVLLTPFADPWSPELRDTVRVVAGLAVVAAGTGIAVVTFVAVTLAVGGPFYERLSERVDDGLGGVPPATETSWARALLRGARDGLLLVALSVAAAIPLFVLGLVPVVGTVAAPVAAALVGGRLLVIELTAPAMERRGVRLAARRRLVRSRRALSWGVGVPTYLLAAIPFVAIIAVPVGAAAATLLTRELHGERTTAAPI
jgi:CysZ protein